MLYFLALFAIPLISARTEEVGCPEEGDPCNFSYECQDDRSKCEILDAAFVCNLGKCKIDGSGFFQNPNPECETFEDCDCRHTPFNCKCSNGECKKEKVECQENKDCLKLAKCDGLDCQCIKNRCENYCTTTQDCIDRGFSCSSRFPEPRCKCVKGLCETKDETKKNGQYPDKKCGQSEDEQSEEKQCHNIGDCVEKGLCKADLPCDCNNNHCEEPYLEGLKSLRSRYGPQLNCNYDSDCKQYIYDCRDGKCECWPDHMCHKTY